MKSDRFVSCVVLSAALAAAISVAPRTAAAAACTVAFSSPVGVGITYAQARSTFAISTGINAAGKSDTCANKAPSNAFCFTYMQPCTAGNWIFVDDATSPSIGHFHLGFTGPGFNPLCGFVDPGDGYGSGFGKTVGGACTTPTWGSEPRDLESHVASQWIRIQSKNFTSFTVNPPVLTFAAKRIQVGNGGKIQFWFHSVLDGNWYFWDHLTANTNWTLAAAHDTDQVLISGETGGTAPFVVSNFDVN